MVVLFFFLSKLWHDVHSISNPQFIRFKVIFLASHTGGRGREGAGTLHQGEIQESRRWHGGRSLVRGFLLLYCSCSPLPTFYHSDVRTALWGEKRDDQRENKQHLHLDAAEKPSHPEGKMLFMPLPAATSGPAKGEEVRAWALGWCRASWYDWFLFDLFTKKPPTL